MKWTVGHVLLALVGARSIHRLPLRCHKHTVLNHSATRPYELNAMNLSYDSMLVLSGYLSRPLHSVSGMMYTINATLNGTVKRLIVDSGSSDLWVKASASGLTANSTDENTTTSDDNEQLQYGQGEVSGVDAKFLVCVGHGCIKNQTAVLATHVKDISGAENFDGLLGLAFPSLQQDRNGPTFLQTLSNNFSNLAFSLDLNSDRTTSYVAFGEFGEVVAEARKMTSHHGVSLPLLAPLYWMSGMQVSVPTRQLGPISAIATFDSGTSLLAVPVSLFQSLTSTMLDKQDCSQYLFLETGQLVCKCDIEVQPLIFSFFFISKR